MITVSLIWLLPRSHKIINFQRTASSIGRKCPYLNNFMGLGLFFWVWNGTTILLARANEHIARARKQHQLRRTAYSSSEKEVGSHGRSFAPHQATISPKAWPMWRGHANARPPRRAAKSCGGGLAWCRCNIDETAVCVVDYCSMLARVLCALFFFWSRCERSAKKVVVLWALGRVTAPCAHRTARPTHALHNVPPWRRLTAFA